MIKINVIIPLEYESWESLRDCIYDVIDWEDGSYSDFLKPDSGFFNYLEEDRKDLITKDDIIDFLQHCIYYVLKNYNLDYNLWDLLKDSKVEVIE